MGDRVVRIDGATPTALTLSRLGPWASAKPPSARFGTAVTLELSRDAPQEAPASAGYHPSPQPQVAASPRAALEEEEENPGPNPDPDQASEAREAEGAKAEVASPPPTQQLRTVSPTIALAPTLTPTLALALAPILTPGSSPQP